MANTATVSFKLAPERYALVQAMAQGKGKSLSEFVRETVEGALDLDRQLDLLAALFAEPEGEAED